MIDISYKRDRNVVTFSATEESGDWRDVRQMFTEQAEYLELESGTQFSVPIWSLLARLDDLSSLIQSRGMRHLIRPDSEITKILKKAQSSRDAVRSAQEPVEDVSGVNLTKQLENAGFQRNLTDFQTTNVARLIQRNAAATFSVPGAGKTTEALAYFALTKGADDKLLVVCPKNAFPVWEEEIRECLGIGPMVSRLVGGRDAIAAALSSSPDMTLITYSQLPLVLDVMVEFLARHPTFMILDESHRIKKGPSGVHAKAVLELSYLPVSKLIMSGTPLPNSLDDLVPQFHFLFPGLGSSADDVVRWIKPFYVRTTKKDLDLPPIDLFIRHVQLRPMHREFYELLRSEEARTAAKYLSARGRITLRHYGRSIMRLLQAVSNPSLLVREGTQYPVELIQVLQEGDAPKIEYACKRARELALKGEKVIIWSSFVKNVETVAERLQDIGAAFIHGGVEAGSEYEDDTREGIIKRFKEERDALVLVANPAAAAESISLHTVCHHAIYIDRTYNAAHFLQSQDRIHRFGLDRDVKTTIEILHSPDTLDDSIDRRLGQKLELMASVLDDSSISVDPVETDMDEDGIDERDVDDFVQHLNSS